VLTADMPGLVQYGAELVCQLAAADVPKPDHSNGQRWCHRWTGARGKDSNVQAPNSSLSVRPVVALAWVIARSSALFFGCEKPCAVPL